ncbi:response regulator transcription factor [Candidatus Soleaferrea massiliensis]|uniref:response regulator transcription factor n=1 Tax=Candidatus Soleaferrea massiliensis TaxID=1470354 RepID=UPI00058C5F61|nr:response regulator [Candidatus Soleaferrea massiliensis]
MIRVLLADDNKSSLDYFAEMIDWERYGFQLVSTAVDGENAWMDFQKHHPQLVITDIQMPVLSGIELTEKINAAAPDTVVIFLSSYSEFKYAQAALKLKVFDYLLKHETEPDTLLKKLFAVKEHLEKQGQQKKILSEDELLNLYQEYVHGQQTVKPKYYPVLKHRYDFYYIEQNHILEAMARHLPDSTPLISEALLKQTCYQDFPDVSAVIKTAPYQYLVLARTREETLQMGYQLRDRLEDMLQASFSAVILGQSLSSGECMQRYLSLSEQLSQLYFYPVSSVIDSGYLQNRGDDSAFLQDTGGLQKTLAQRERPSVHLVDEWYSKAIQLKHYPSFCRITELFLTDLLQYHQRIIDVGSGQIFSVTDPSAPAFWCDAYSIYQWVKQQYARLLRILPDTKSRYSEIVSETIDVISRRYMDVNLNVDELASQLHVSVSGLNTIFKKETGQTVWKMIVKTRMEHARKLLEQNEYSISEICTMAGYNSLSYFSKVFRKTFDISPQAYRRQNHEKTGH